ncbi:hypothetical protein M413DRAFT_74240 [Hebeloma cylindrosporum]|uniref:Cytochrome P450 n=1 Tax=Hebeloma cylindrosporum TaxID=76867 RepID=A0A0C3C663_HEBCY|nr:hypothetical protein M413DRAFT_74240 [Hebeloma cylindrosporum h7]
MLLLFAKGIALYGVSWFLWQIFKHYIASSPLDNIPGPSSKSWLKGVYPQLFGPRGWDFHREIAEKYGSVIKIKARLGENQLYIFDPKAMHHVIVKDQSVYEEPTSVIEGNKLMFGPGILGTLGEQHRKQRKMLNPVFSIAHMREMIPTFYRVSYKLRDAFARKVEDGPQEIDVLSWMSRTALELIGQSGLGYSFDPLTEDSNQHIFSKSAKELVPLSFKIAFSRRIVLETPLIRLGTSKFRRLIVDLIPWKTLHQLRDIADVIHSTSVEIINSKKQALEEGDESVARQIGQGKDILSILMRANMDAYASGEDSLTEEELTAQVSSLTFAAMDTTSGALGRILFLLSIHQDVQNKLRQEIREARKSGDLSYDELVALPYLDAVCRETLRVYPPLSTTSRTTRTNTLLPLSTPITGLDGREMNAIPIPNNTNVIISIYAANRNPEVWGPDSYDWKPERWLNPLPETVSGARIPGIYSHLMTFFGGGRACIGFKFSQLEMKVVLSLLVESFRFSPTGKEVIWHMSGLATPTVPCSGSPRSQLPLRVEKAA